MLTVAKVTGSVAGGYAEYLAGRSNRQELGDYYLRDGMRVEAPGRWVMGASWFGRDATAAVSSEELAALMSVRRPDTGQPLRRVGGDGTAVAAIDATFSAPKSVSAIWALGDQAERVAIEDAHERAIDRALSYAIDRVAMVRERTDGPAVHAHATSMVATSWRHTTARAVDGVPPDPQLHSHVLLHAAVRRDGKLVAVDSRSWLVHRRELGAAYRTELARELHLLGYTIHRGTGRGGRYFEIGGVPQQLLDRWSSRHRQVATAIDQRLQDRRQELRAEIAAGGADAAAAERRLGLLEAYGQLAPREERGLALATRATKNALLTRDDLDHAWRTAADQAGFEPRAITTPYERRLDPASDRELLARLTEFDATFAARDARAVALEASAGSRTSDAVDRLAHLRDQHDLLRLEDGRYTTSQHRRTESQTVLVAERLAAAKVTPLTAGSLSDTVIAVDQRLAARGGRGLSGEQRAALELACGDRQLVIIEGQAGTGKSTVLGAIARVQQDDGQQVIITSTAALAAQRLSRELQDVDVTAVALSTAALRTAVRTGEVTLGPDTTVIHDEAALASTREQKQLLGAVHAAGARVILVGDPRQNQAVGAGGLWEHIEQTARDNEAHVELTRNLRAKEPADKEAQHQFRAGLPEAALRNYHERGRVMFAVDQRRAEDAALEAAHADRTAGKRTLVIAQTSNEHLDELNARAQAIRRQAGQLGTHGMPVLGRPYELREGDDVQIRRTIYHPDHGDLRNGTTATIAAIDTSGDRLWLTLADGDRVRLDRAQLDGADLRLAYVQHPFPAQGHTTDTAHLIVAEHTTREGAYVAITRARDRTHIHAATDPDATANGIDPIAELATRINRTEPQVPSIDTPLAHERDITARHVQEGTPEHDQPGRETDPDTPSYLLAALGPPPAETDPRRRTWQDAARTINSYRTRYAIPDIDPTPLGPDPNAGRFIQRHERQQAAQQLLAAREELGHERSLTLGEERSTQAQHPGIEQNDPPRDRDPGWGWEP